MAKKSKFKILLPYECLFDLRWGFIRQYSGLTDLELFPRFNAYCGRLTDDLTQYVPTLTAPFKADVNVVSKSPRTAILTLISNVFRQYYSDSPDTTFTLHITLDFSTVPFIPKEVRNLITDQLKATLNESGNAAHVVSVNRGYEGYTIKELRSSFQSVVVYSLDEFVSHYNAKSRQAYEGLGIITRPLFVDAKAPEEFHKLINGIDKRNVHTGTVIDPGDHYDILTDAFSHIGPIYFHEPQYFSAITPR